MNKEMIKLKRAIVKYYGGDEIPYRLDSDCFEYDDGVAHVEVRWIGKGYLLTSNIKDDDENNFETDHAGAMAESMHLSIINVHLEKPVLEMKKQIKAAMKEKGIDYSHLAHEIGIRIKDVRDSVKGREKMSVRYLHGIARALGKKIVLADA